MKIDKKAIKELAELIEETGLTEIEVVDGDQMIRVGKNAGAQVIASAGHSSSPNMTSDPTVPQIANTEAPSNIAANHPGAVVSPMVGTVYLQAEPDSPAFVQKGSTVNAGDTLVIVEAMKVMNPIKAEKGGTVTHIMVDNGDPVEYGDVIMVIE